MGEKVTAGIFELISTQGLKIVLHVDQDRADTAPAWTLFPMGSF